MTAAGLWLRRLRDDAVAVAVLGSLLLVTAFVFGLTPRLLDRLAQDALEREVAAGSPFARNVQLVQERHIAAGPRGAPLAPVDAVGDQLAGELPPAVASLVGSRGVVVDSPRFATGLVRPADTFLRIRFQPGAEARIRYEAGGPPTGATTTLERPALPRDEDQAPRAVSVLEGAVSVTAARQLHAAVGDLVDLAADPTDRLARGHTDRLALRITGLFSVTDRSDPWWLDDPSLADVSVRALGGDTIFYDTTALLAPEAYGGYVAAIQASGLPIRYTWRYYVDPTRLDASRADALVIDLRRLDTRFPISDLGATGGGDTAMRSGLRGLVEAQRARWRSTENVLAVLAMGPAAVAITALALVTLLAGRRGRLVLPIWHARGASRGQLARAIAVEGALLSVPASTIAVLLSIALVPAAAVAPTVVAAAVVAVAGTLLLLGTWLPGRVGQREVAAPRRGRGRIVAEVVVVVLAIAGAYLLRERGIAGASSAAALGGVDPFVAAVPALVGVAAALVAVRLHPLPLRLAAAVAAGQRGLVPSLAVRRAVDGSSARAVLVVLLATASVGAFSSAVLVNLDRSAAAIGWHDVGAAFRIRPPTDRFPLGFEVGALRGAERVAVASLLPATVIGRGDQSPLLALDLPAYRQVAAGTPAEPNVPASMLAASANPVPAIVSGAFAATADGLHVGDRFTVLGGGHRVALIVAAVRDTFPSLAIDQRFIVVSLPQWRTAVPADVPITAVYVRAPESAAADLRSSATRAVPGAAVDSQAERTAAIHDRPSAIALAAGVAAAVIVAAAFAALAVAAALGLAGASRANETAHLRTLGLSRRQAVALVVVEHAPTVALGFLGGAVLGIGLFVFLRRSLGLDVVVGSTLDVPIAVDAPSLALVLAGIVAIATLGIGLGVILQQRAVTAVAVRRGIE
jgi:putative ABC transport system permease protein